MKIKTDFITNSSSTAFIVCLPDDWYPTEEEIKQAYETYSHHEEIGLDFEDRLRKAVDDLRNGSMIYIGDDYDLYYALITCLNDGHIVYSYDSGASEGGYVENIRKETLLRVLSAAYSGKPFKENINITILGEEVKSYG